MKYWLGGGLCGALAATAAKLASAQKAVVLSVALYGVQVLLNVVMGVLFAKALDKHSSVKATVLTVAANFIFSGLLGRFVFGETAKLSFWVGVSLIVVGIVLITKAGGSHAKRHDGGHKADAAHADADVLEYDAEDAEPASSAASYASLAARVRAAVQKAHAFFTGELRGDHWRAELESNVTVTDEAVLLYYILGLQDLLEKHKAGFIKYISSMQNKDGSWGIASNYKGDVSTSAESYLALRILGIPDEDPVLRKACTYIRENGGLEKVRIFTRINFALFGLIPWNACPAIPPEIIFLPSWFPINIYKLASWARGTLVPLLILFHYRPIFSLPNGRSENNDFLDHLWLNPLNKKVPYRQSIFQTLLSHGLGWKLFFNCSDLLLTIYDKSLWFPLCKIFRNAGVKSCMRWVLEHQEKSGDWDGIFPPMCNGLIALHCHGYKNSHDCMVRGIQAVENFGWDDEQGYRIEACQSPVWDTCLGVIGLIDSGFSVKDPRLAKARKWLESNQLINDYGDYRVYNPHGRSGGWAFEYFNTWYPDVDDTAAVIISFMKHDPSTKGNESITRAVDWMISMQNKDGGWGAFDLNNDAMYLNQIPFSDMDALCDPSSPDIAGRLLEAFGILGDPRIKSQCERAVEYLRNSQEPEGSWFGRWGVNYIYGTSNVLNGLMRQNIPETDEMVVKGVKWLLSVQNADGGWGETVSSYRDRGLMGRGRTTPSQTAWALMGLLAYLPPHHTAIKRGVAWLLDNQNKSGKRAGAWEEEEFTGTGFPNHFYLRYHYYCHYFPLMALGRFVKNW
eukprot:TRINITY_DN28209_c0_g1_i2.p1 TRINITY_DN28209_c0_g1~~TRINITY_DN28209_c0_g1_i2.p1  ORF type:complete len:793 (-),score=117.30 TRINITY_DN28209_c0_g1_i2:51-2429(-)